MNVCVFCPLVEHTLIFDNFCIQYLSPYYLYYIRHITLLLHILFITFSDILSYSIHLKQSSYMSSYIYIYISYNHIIIYHISYVYLMSSFTCPCFPTFSHVFPCFPMLRQGNWRPSASVPRPSSWSWAPWAPPAPWVSPRSPRSRRRSGHAPSTAR